jgi:flagella synthesis protein FlgN
MQSMVNGPGASLAQEYQAAQALLAVLRQEQKRLLEADAESLTALLAEKSRVAAHIGELALGRHRALAGAGFDGNETGMRAWITRLAADSDIAQSWNQLLELAREAKEINRINGLLINRQLARNQAALNVLQGVGQNANLYGPDGQAANRMAARSRVIG